jgi:hypothetical protein
LCPCKRREAKAKEKKRHPTDVFHEKLTFLKNQASAGLPAKQDQKAKESNYQGIIPQNYKHSACAWEFIQWTLKLSFPLTRNVTNRGSRSQERPSSFGKTQVVETPLIASFGGTVGKPEVTARKPARSFAALRLTNASLLNYRQDQL